MGGHLEPLLEPVDIALRDVAPRRALIIEGPVYGSVGMGAARWSEHCWPRSVLR
jgi:hypothetical protein